MKKTIFIAAMLAVATVLAAGLTVLPSSVQEAQANPCSNDASRGGGEAGGRGSDQECKFIGNFEGAFEEETSDSDLAATETEGAEATAGNNIINDPSFDLSGIDVIDEVN